MPAPIVRRFWQSSATLGDRATGTAPPTLGSPINGSIMTLGETRGKTPNPKTCAPRLHLM